MGPTVKTCETGHDDMVHDVQMDYYGKRMATCSSDRTIKVFDVSRDPQVHIADLTGHDGPVWQVAWAHPKFGSILASCSYDRRVIIWKETENGWTNVYQTPDNPKPLHEASVNSISWAPHQWGLVLACASSDGTLSVLTRKADNTWDTDKVPRAHAIGCTSVSWAPAAAPASLVNGGPVGTPVKRLASAGCDNKIKVWRCRDGASGDSWVEEFSLEGHTDWARDVAWAPNLGLPTSTIASCGQDGRVFIWTQANEGDAWQQKLVHNFKVPVWRLSWSITGNILAVSCSDNEVTLWKEGVDGKWSQVSTVQSNS
eukprot:jgi/Mesvir1/2906/Mv13977-RA.1